MDRERDVDPATESVSLGTRYWSRFVAKTGVEVSRRPPAGQDLKNVTDLVKHFIFTDVHILSTCFKGLRPWVSDILGQPGATWGGLGQPGPKDEDE